MLAQCRGCSYYERDNSKMKGPGTKTIVGDYCLRFKWNLAVYKDWQDKHSEVKGKTYPQMKHVPKTCFTRRPV